jgi:outer membrane lipoprotein carrier protein
MQTIRRSVVQALATLSVAFAPVASAQTPAATVDKAIAAWSRVRSLSGTFEQSLTNPLLRSTSVAHGDFSQQRPNKLAIRFTDPAGDAIVADGKFVWVYMRQAAPNQVIKTPQTDDMGVPLDLSQFLDATGSRYDLASKGADNVGGRPAKVIVLTPKKNTQAAFTTATIWVDDADGLIRQFEVAEPSGTIRRIRLTKVNMNPVIKASDFAFTVPKGAKVVIP